MRKMRPEKINSQAPRFVAVMAVIVVVGAMIAVVEMVVVTEGALMATVVAVVAVTEGAVMDVAALVGRIF